MKNEDGFTLIEILIALVIMGVAFSILVQGYAGVIASVDQNLNYLYISSWAEAKLIELDKGINLENHGNFIYHERSFEWWIEEIYLTDSLKKLKLNINWPGQWGRKHYDTSRLVLIQE